MGSTPGKRRGRGRPRSWEEPEGSLFDDPTPLDLPTYTYELLTSKQDFISQAKEALGRLAIISNAGLSKTMDNERPNQELANFINTTARGINMAVEAYLKLSSLEEDSTTKQPPETIRIEFKQPPPLTC